MITIDDSILSDKTEEYKAAFTAGFVHCKEQIEKQNRTYCDINGDYQFLSSTEVETVINRIKQLTLSSEEVRQMSIVNANRLSELRETSQAQAADSKQRLLKMLGIEE